MGEVVRFSKLPWARPAMWTRDMFALRIAEMKAQQAASELHLLRLQQFQQFFTQQKTSRGEWR